MFTNEQLAEVAKARCTTPGDLGKIDGIGPARLEKYGADLLAGCCSQGATREEALANIREAIAEYQEAKFLVREGEPGVRVQHAEVSV